MDNIKLNDNCLETLLYYPSLTNNVRNLYDRKLFTDLTITLFDEIDTLKIDVHKIIISASFLYFENILTSTNENEIEINVPNAQISRDLILSCYDRLTIPENMSKTIWMIEYIRCCNYFMIPHDIQLPINLNVPYESFDKLLELAKILQYNGKIIRIINNNLPIKHDIRKLSVELIDAMVSVDTGYKFLEIFMTNEIIINFIDADYTVTKYTILPSLFKKDIEEVYSEQCQLIGINDDNYIYIWNTVTKLPYIKIYIPRPLNYCISPNNQMIAILQPQGAVSIYDLRKHKFIEIIGDVFCYKIIFTSDNKNVIFTNYKYIWIYDLTSHIMLRTIGLIGYENYDSIFAQSIICCSVDNELIASCVNKNVIKIWNIVNLKCIDTYIPDDEIYLKNLCFLNNKRILFTHNSTIFVWDLLSRIVVHKVDIGDEIIAACYSLHDDKFILCHIDKINVFNASDYKLFKTIIIKNPFTRERGSKLYQQQDNTRVLRILESWKTE